MPTPRPRSRARSAIGVGVLLLVVAGLWIGFLTWRVQASLGQAQSQAVALQNAMAAGDQASATKRLDDFETGVADASDITEGVTWRVLGSIPILGNTFDAIRTVVSVGEDLGPHGLQPLVHAGDAVDSKSFAPVDGKVPLGRFGELKRPVAASLAAFTVAEKRLDAQSLSFVPNRVTTTYQGLEDKVRRARSTFDVAKDAVEVLPGMLGRDGKRSYLLAVQNNSEIRSSGGMPGSQALLVADKGKVSITDQTPAADLGVFDKPVLPLTPAERAIYDTHPAIYPADTNFTPEFPRTARLMAAMWKARKHQQVDGVLTLDLVTMGYLLKATGPIQGPDGELTADNFVDQTAYAANMKYRDTARQNDYYAEVTKRVTQAVMNGKGSSTELLAALRKGVVEGRVKVASFHEPEQRVLDGSHIAGQLPEASKAPELGVYVNDATGSKMSYFLRYDVDVVSGRCSRGVQTLDARATFTFKSPDDPANLPDNITGGGAYGTPAGEQTLLIRVYGPDGGSMSGWTFDGEKIPVPSIDDRGRPVASPVVQLRAGQSTVMRWKVTSGPGQTDTAHVDVTPGIHPGSASGSIGTRCGTTL